MKTTSSNSKISKQLSYILRHKPESIELELDINGWGDIHTILNSMNITLERLEVVVKTDNKNRYEIDYSRNKIRARQGHSINVSLGYTNREPPTFLYHGTALKNLESILENGILKDKRHAVHLSESTVQAFAVGRRHGSPIALIIKSNAMYNDGFKFQLSGNNIWLTENVPNKYIFSEYIKEGN